jgi:hypothetical protein
LPELTVKLVVAAPFANTTPVGTSEATTMPAMHGVVHVPLVAVKLPGVVATCVSVKSHVPP